MHTFIMKLTTKNFSDLAFNKQVEIINQSLLQDKGDLILDSDSPETIIASLVPENFYQILIHSDKDNWPDLFKHANSNQMVFTSDFECWETDVINQNQLLSWIDMLYLSGEEVILRWILDVDFEFLVGGLMDFIEVIKTEHLELIDDYIGDRPFFTLDNMYYICIDCDNLQPIKRVLEMLFVDHKKKYLVLLEALIATGKAEIVEAAYKFRNDRLTIFGFPDKEEGFRIYLSLEDWSQIKPKENIKAFSKISNKNQLYPVLENNGLLFIDKVLDICDSQPDFLSEFTFEITSLTNKIIICENMDFRDHETTLTALLRVKSFLSIALEELSSNNIEKAKDILERYWLEDIFRRGITLTKRLKSTVENIYTKSTFDDFHDFAKFAGHPLEDKLHGACKFIPMKLKDNSSFEVMELEDFSNYKQLRYLGIELEEFQELLSFFTKHFGLDLKNIINKDFSELNYHGDNLNIISLLATYVIHQGLTHQVMCEPLDEDAIKKFVDIYFQNKEEINVAYTNLKLKCQKLLFTDKVSSSLILDSIFDLLSHELENIDISAKIETFYFLNLLTRK